MTKEQLIQQITSALKTTGQELCVVEYQNKLRNGRCGLHAYNIVYFNDGVYCNPWAGAIIYWKCPWEKLTKTEVQAIYDKLDTTLALFLRLV